MVAVSREELRCSERITVKLLHLLIHGLGQHASLAWLTGARSRWTCERMSWLFNQPGQRPHSAACLSKVAWLRSSHVILEIQM